jgi:hypothetical protein
MKITIDKAPECLNTNDKAMWVLGWNEAVDALKEALAQPEQEPVAWMFQHEETGRTMCVDAQQVEWGFEKGNPRLQKIGPLYTSPPKPDLTDADRKTYQAGHNAGVAHHKQATKRKWVGLTFAEVNEIEQDGEFWKDHTPLDFANAIEAKLKELNT